MRPANANVQKRFYSPPSICFVSPQPLLSFRDENRLPPYLLIWFRSGQSLPQWVRSNDIQREKRSGNWVTGRNHLMFKFRERRIQRESSRGSGQQRIRFHLHQRSRFGRTNLLSTTVTLTAQFPSFFLNFKITVCVRLPRGDVVGHDVRLPFVVKKCFTSSYKTEQKADNLMSYVPRKD